MHLIFLIFGVIIWIVYSHIEGISKARNRYLLNAPELDVVKNGIRWLREHNLNKTRYMKIGLVYALIIGLKMIYLSYSTVDYSWVELSIMITAILLVPVCLFPFFHDTAYYKEYNRLAKVDYPEPWFFEKRIAANIIQVGKRERWILLFCGIGLFLCETYIFFT
jgi:hypothetical protein